jgi:hypothetical protein
VRKRGCHLGIGEASQERDERGQQKAEPHAFSGEAGGGADDGIDSGTDDDADAIKQELDGTECRFELCHFGIS